MPTPGSSPKTVSARLLLIGAEPKAKATDQHANWKDFHAALPPSRIAWGGDASSYKAARGALGGRYQSMWHVTPALQSK
jgi:hypothetical protein